MARSAAPAAAGVAIARAAAGVARALAAAGALGIGAASALAAPGAAAEVGGDGPRRLVPTPAALFAAPLAPISPTIYLERCRGSCTVLKGINDARAMTSSIPMNAGQSILSEYRNGAGMTGSAADAEWAALVTCVREVYSPFRVTVTDVRPVDGTYHVAIVAGSPNQIGFGSDVLGVAPLANDCSPVDNVISFSFANAHPQTDPAARVANLCWTVAQESAHAFGLDHQYAFVADGRSACNDPMTYRTDCGGQKFFRNEEASCGEFQTRPCRCSGSQTSHQKLVDVFGPGTSLIPAPVVTLTAPRAGDALPAAVTLSAGSRRGIARVELLLNGYRWAEIRGAPFGPSGQANPASYSIEVPPAVPNSIIDLKVRAYDDLGAFTETPLVTVTKGGPCVTADTCAKGQRCEAGRCLWDPPVGQLGEPCSYPQYCTAGLCEGPAGQQLCSQACTRGAIDACPDGFECAAGEGGRTVCLVASYGGCCSVSGGSASGAPWAQLLLASATLGLLLRPWRRRR
jgi:hypothetical protein